MDFWRQVVISGFTFQERRHQNVLGLEEERTAWFLVPPPLFKKTNKQKNPDYPIPWSSIQNRKQEKKKKIPTKCPLLIWFHLNDIFFQARLEFASYILATTYCSLPSGDPHIAHLLFVCFHQESTISQFFKETDPCFVRALGICAV